MQNKTIRDYTIKYVPKSTVHSNKKQVLSPGGIAGIVVAGIVILIIMAFSMIAYLEYHRRVTTLSSKFLHMLISFSFFNTVQLCQLRGHRITGRRRRSP